MTSIPPRLVSALASRYRIHGAIGRGGMADVYRALDLKHDRTVALKVLREELAVSVGAARFLAEIRTTANLQHPHILPLFDSGEAEGHLFYVMPFVEGESLASRIARENQLPVDDAVRIACAVASALDYAHRHGVIHRDIKPANILLHDGQPLIADFGIALAVQAAGGERLTATGLRVGTPAYMSPEQIAGDSRIGPASDVYALGCVVYEMLVGEPPYTGRSMEALVGRILRGERQSITGVRKVSPNVNAAIARALEPVPADRFRSAHDFAESLSNPAYRHRDTSLPQTRRSVAAVALVGWLAAIAITLGWITSSDRADASRPVTRTTIEIPPGQQVTGLGVTPDGRTLFYAANGLYRRRLDALRPEELPHTEGARDLAVGPDGDWIAFVRGRRDAISNEDTVYRIRASGGLPVRIATLPYVRGIAWDSGGRLIIGSHSSGLWRVPANGGTVEQLTNAERSPPHRYPHVLPGRRGILFHIFGSGTSDSIAVLPEGAKRWRVLTEGRDPVFVPPDHLVFSRNRSFGEGSLWAARFDLDHLQLSTEPIPLTTFVRWRARTLQVVGHDGTLFFAQPHRLPQKSLVWVDHDGIEKQLAPSADPFQSVLRLSPDGRFLLHVRETRLWISDLQRSVEERLTDEGSAEWAGIWSRDGRSVVFMSRISGPFDLYRIALVGPKRIEAIGTNGGRPADWTVDGTGLLYVKNGLRLRSLDTGTDELLLDEPVGRPRMSPDGRWIAYESTVDGGTGVFLRPYPNVTANRWRIPGENSHNVGWSPDATKLYFLERGALNVVRVSPTDSIPLGPPKLLLKGPYAEFDVGPDGRILAVRESSQPDSVAHERVVVVQNWMTDLTHIYRK